MFAVGHAVGDVTHDDVVHELLSDHPINTLALEPDPLYILVVVAESVELHVGKLMLDAVVHVKVTTPELIAWFFILPPLALLPFNVIVLVFAVAQPVNVPVAVPAVPVAVKLLLPPLFQPVSHVTVYEHWLLLFVLALPIVLCEPALQLHAEHVVAAVFT